ncbi:uncharacterized protein TRIVIDRAFT_51771, partial [Trichoderma virens Gv29-8]
MILKQLFLISYTRKQRDSQEDNRKRAAYAAVSPEWKYYFEAKSFLHLTLHQSDLPDFGKIVQRDNRQIFVNFICLRLQLPEYDCSKCRERESPEEVRANQSLFTNAVWQLFSILSTWMEQRKIGLELSVHSPSDALHYCQELKGRIRDNVTVVPRYRKSTTKRKSTHGWRRGRQVHFPPENAKLRVFGHPNGLGFDLQTPLAQKLRALPKVNAVNWLLIRRQFYRHFSIPNALGPMIKSLTCLETFQYEPWQG